MIPLFPSLKKAWLECTVQPLPSFPPLPNAGFTGRAALTLTRLACVSSSISQLAWLGISLFEMILAHLQYHLA